jgi:hypothetical protein
MMLVPMTFMALVTAIVMAFMLMPKLTATIVIARPDAIIMPLARNDATDIAHHNARDKRND